MMLKYLFFTTPRSIFLIIFFVKPEPPCKKSLFPISVCILINLVARKTKTYTGQHYQFQENKYLAVRENLIIGSK